MDNAAPCLYCEMLENRTFILIINIVPLCGIDTFFQPIFIEHFRARTILYSGYTKIVKAFKVLAVLELKVVRFHWRCYKKSTSETNYPVMNSKRKEDITVSHKRG